MNNKVLFYAAMASLLFGCESIAQAPPGPVPCNTPVCQVRIDVVSGRITVNPPDLTIAKGNQGPGGRGVTIHWVLQNGNFQFRADAIRFYDPAHPTEFFDPEVQSNGGQFKWTDRNSAKQPPWGYQITVHPKAGGDPLTLDPAVVNDGP